MERVRHFVGGAGKSGSLALAAARGAGAARTVGVVVSGAERDALVAAGLADEVVVADARDPVAVSAAVVGALGGPATVTVALSPSTVDDGESCQVRADPLPPQDGGLADDPGWPATSALLIASVAVFADAVAGRSHATSLAQLPSPKLERRRRSALALYSPSPPVTLDQRSDQGPDCEGKEAHFACGCMLNQ